MKRDKNKLAQQDSTSNEDNSTSSEDDENAELLTEEVEEGFFKVLSRLKKKDSELYEGSQTFFTDSNQERDDQTNSKEGKIKKKKGQKKEKVKKWLKGEKQDIGNEEVKEDLKALHDFWTNPKLNKDEQFLRDYILNQKFLETDQNFNIEEEVNKLSDEEKEVEEQMIFEHKYNCRFENEDQDAVENIKPTTKRKKNKPVQKVLENDHSLNPNKITSKSGGDRGSIANAVDAKLLNKKRKKKRNHNYSEDQIITEETKAKKQKKKTEDGESNLLAAQNSNTKTNEDMSQVDKTIIGKGEYEKSLRKKKRKRRSRKRHSAVKTSNINGEKIIECETNQAKKKLKVKGNFKCSISDTPERKEKAIVSKDEHMSTYNLPRNLQMKNEKKKSKMRHRNRKKALLETVANRVSVQTDGKNKDGVSHHMVKTNQKKMEKKQKHSNKQNEFVVGTKKKINNFKTKKNKQFQNLIVKEKKDKELRFKKIRSKKQKALNAVHKR